MDRRSNNVIPLTVLELGSLALPSESVKQKDVSPAESVDSSYLKPCKATHMNGSSNNVPVIPLPVLALGALVHPSLSVEHKDILRAECVYTGCLEEITKPVEIGDQGSLPNLPKLSLNKYVTRHGGENKVELFHRTSSISLSDCRSNVDKRPEISRDHTYAICSEEEPVDKRLLALDYLCMGTGAKVVPQDTSKSYQNHSLVDQSLKTDNDIESNCLKDDPDVDQMSSGDDETYVIENNDLDDVKEVSMDFDTVSSDVENSSINKSTSTSSCNEDIQTTMIKDDSDVNEDSVGNNATLNTLAPDNPGDRCVRENTDGPNDNIKTAEETNDINADTRYKCMSCCEEFFGLKSLRHHRRTVHENEHPYYCDRCGFSTGRTSSLKQHMKSEPDCGKISDPGIPALKCHICGTLRGGPEALKSHKIIKHTCNHELVCHSCGFSSDRHRVGKFKAHDCNRYKFPTDINTTETPDYVPESTAPSKQVAHMNATLNSVGPQKSSKTKSSLKLRLRDLQYKSIWECPLESCSYVYFSKHRELDSHFLKHHPDKMYCTCDICGHQSATEETKFMHKTFQNVCNCKRREKAECKKDLLKMRAQFPKLEDLPEFSDEDELLDYLFNLTKFAKKKTFIPKGQAWCPICENCFSRLKPHLRNHRKIMDTCMEQKKLLCFGCFVHFDDAHMLNKHKATCGMVYLGARDRQRIDQKKSFDNSGIDATDKASSGNLTDQIQEFNKQACGTESNCDSSKTKTNMAGILSKQIIQKRTEVALQSQQVIFQKWNKYMLAVLETKPKHLCDHCGESFTSYLLFNEHVSAHTKKANMMCSYCGKMFFTKKSLKIHVKEQRCKNARAMHRINKLKTKWLQCEFCNATFYRQTAKLTHLLNVHGKSFPDMFQCDGCPKQFKTLKQLTLHVRGHLQTFFNCSVCNKKLKKRSLMPHMKMMHSDIQPEYVCSDCDVICPTKSQLVAHQRKQHNAPDKRLVLHCPQCSFSTKNAVSQKAHILATHTDTVFKCKHCDATFKRDTSRLRHVQLKHEKSESIVCEVCGAAFIQRASFNRHKKTHENLRYICDICGASYSQTHPMMKHREKSHPDASKCQISDLLQKGPNLTTSTSTTNTGQPSKRKIPPVKQSGKGKKKRKTNL